MNKKLFEVDLTLTPGQQAIDDCGARFTVVKAGRRFGKSIYAIWRTIRAALNHAGVVVWYVGPYHHQVEEIAWDAILSMLPKGTVVRKNESKLKIWLINGSVIELKGADNEDSLRGIGALRGLKLVVFEEAAYIKPFIWERIVRPPLMDIGGDAIFISSPRGGWFSRLYDYAKFQQNYGDKSWAAFRFTSYDNPHVKKEEIDKAINESSDRTARFEYLAEDEEAGGLVYPEFKESIHVVEPFEFPRSWWQMLSCDWGIANPTVALWWAVDPKTNNVYITQEHYQGGWSVPRQAQRIRALSTPPRDNLALRVIDASAMRRESAEDEMHRGRFSSVLQGFQNHGISFLPASRRKEHDIELCRRFIESKTGQPSLFFFRTCRNTIRELLNYEYDNDGADKINVSEVPKGSHHDAMDAMRYGISEIYRLGKGRITPIGDQKVKEDVEMEQIKIQEDSDIRNDSSLKDHPHNLFRRAEIRDSQPDNFISEFYSDE